MCFNVFRLHTVFLMDDGKIIDQGRIEDLEKRNKLLNLKNPPTSVCCVSDTVAVGAMQSLRNHNLSPGKEVSLIGYDGLELGGWIDPPLSTMKQPLQSVGKDLAVMLMNLVNFKKKPAELQKLFRASLLRRGTDNPPLVD